MPACEAMPGELGLHALEQRPRVLGAQVAHREPVLRAGVRVDHDHRRARVLEHVLPRLAEELERQRDVLRVDVVHFGDVGDVRRAVARAGGDHRRHGAFEARSQRCAATSGMVRARAVAGAGAGRLLEGRGRREADRRELRGAAAQRAGELRRVADAAEVLASSAARWRRGDGAVGRPSPRRCARRCP